MILGIVKSANSESSTFNVDAIIWCEVKKRKINRLQGAYEIQTQIRLELQLPSSKYCCDTSRRFWNLQKNVEVVPPAPTEPPHPTRSTSALSPGELRRATPQRAHRRGPALGFSLSLIFGIFAAKVRKCNFRCENDFSAYPPVFRSGAGRCLGKVAVHLSFEQFERTHLVFAGIPMLHNTTTENFQFQKNTIQRHIFPDLQTNPNLE